jgi:DNA-binding transcriptional regulator PaaX
VRITRNQKEILKLIGMGLIVASAFVAPNIVQLLKLDNRDKKYRYRKSLSKLFDDNIIYLSGDQVILSDAGKKLLKQAQSEEIVFPRHEDWNGVWHLVCYDIPESRKAERDFLRRKLDDAGFYQIQLSLWVYPFDCKEEVAILAQNLGVAPFVAYLNTDYLPNNERLVEMFDLV